MKIGILLKNKDEIRASKEEVTQFITLLDPVSDFQPGGEIYGGNLRHPDQHHRNRSLGNFLSVFLVIFVVVCFLGSRLVKNTHLQDKENASLKKEEEDFFEMVGLKKVEAYFKLARKKRSFNSSKALIGLLGEEMRRTVIANVREYLAIEETGKLEMETLFPKLSPTECDICRLVLQGKKLGEICSILGKTETNINSTQTHIRRKLNMQPSDNLMKILQARVKAVKDKS